MTRPEPGASATAGHLRAAGWLPVMAPFLTIRGVATPLPAAGRLQAVIAASGNAVALPSQYRTLPLFAVGNATAARARAAGFRTVHSADGDAYDLVELIARDLTPSHGRLLLATGHGQGTGLARLLRSRGFTVHRRAVYAAAPLRRFPQQAAQSVAAGLHAALFFSTETAQSFARSLPTSLRPCLRCTIAAVIGPGAAGALRHLPWRALRIAVRPTQDEVLALL